MDNISIMTYDELVAVYHEICELVKSQPLDQQDYYDSSIKIMHTILGCSRIPRDLFDATSKHATYLLDRLHSNCPPAAFSQLLNSLPRYYDEEGRDPFERGELS